MDNLENNRVYRVKNYPDLDNVWDVFQVDIDKRDSTLKSIQMALFIPHNLSIPVTVIPTICLKVTGHQTDIS